MTNAERVAWQQKRRDKLPPPRPGTSERAPASKPTEKQRRLYRTIVDKSAKVVDKLASEPVKTVDKVIRDAVTEVYNPTAPVKDIMASTGVQKLIIAGEKAGITDINLGNRFASGIFGENENNLGWANLWTRLRYPEVFRPNVNIDNRQVTVYDGMTTEQLEAAIKQKKEELGTTPPVSTPQ